jgi:predicted RNA-binding Zn ribbon-like protein
MDFGSYHTAPTRLAEDLINTYDVANKVEELPDVAALGRFLDDHGIAAPRRLRREDLEAARSLRPRLRAIFGLHDEGEAVAVLNRVLDDCHAVPCFSRHDRQRWHLHVSRPGDAVADQLGAAAAMALLVVLQDQGLDRFRVCTGRRCEDVIVDVSRNQSRRYCSPAVCGNRAHAAAFRARRRG